MSGNILKYHLGIFYKIIWEYFIRSSGNWRRRSKGGRPTVRPNSSRRFSQKCFHFFFVFFFFSEVFSLLLCFRCFLRSVFTSSLFSLFSQKCFHFFFVLVFRSFLRSVFFCFCFLRSVFTTFLLCFHLRRTHQNTTQPFPKDTISFTALTFHTGFTIHPGSKNTHTNIHKHAQTRTNTYTDKNTQIQE